MGKLAGKVSIVSGSGMGIGRAIARAYLQEGAGVVIAAARKTAEIEGLVEEAGAEKMLAILAGVTDRRTASGS